MKKYIVLLFFVLFVVAMAPLVTSANTLALPHVLEKSTIADLGITSVGVIPTSKWYFFKEWGRGFERFFTFNSVKKAELELRITNEKAAEALAVQTAKPDDAKALAAALENYTKAEGLLQTRVAKLKETSENPNVAKLLEKLDEQTLKHAILLNQLAEKYIGDPDFDLIAKTVKNAQEDIDSTVRVAAEKEKNLKEKAADQIERAEDAVGKLKDEYGIEPAGIAIDESGVHRSVLKGTKDVDNQAAEKTGPIRIDSTPARISTNMTIERQTPKRDFGDRMKAVLDTAGSMLANAGSRLALAKTAFAEGKFGEAFGEARAAEVIARNGLRILEAGLFEEGIRPSSDGLEDGIKIAPLRSGTDADMPRIEDVRFGMPIVPGTIDGKIVPEAEKRVFPETNNRTACDPAHIPACLSGEETLECRNGKWVCVVGGSATAGGLITNPTASPSTSDGSIKSSE